MNVSVAIMQPYWIPYAGYFRLLSAADKFVILDDVQFARRGFVHRNRLKNTNGAAEWITLPLKKQARSVLISQLEFHPDWKSLLFKQQAKFPILKKGFGLIDREMEIATDSVCEMIIATLKKYQTILNIEATWFLSSQISNPKLSGEEKILDLVKKLGGTSYVNASGGAHLYSKDLFLRNNIELKFLCPWQGSHLSILEFLAGEESFSEVRKDIFKQTRFTN
ncbi:MAG: hypothetical protein CME45_07035 [Halieaceae bacterium]|nr:hypothetical protein [Halieaceae bacterium]|tara:strand:+ start:974 stop:1639 length:666 start_codon:yes stop_codon:yes gene_type:complete